MTLDQKSPGSIPGGAIPRAGLRSAGAGFLVPLSGGNAVDAVRSRSRLCGERRHDDLTPSDVAGWLFRLKWVYLDII
jgi:hypothetical protein